MATTAGSSTASNIVPAPIATADTQHVCFICLQTDADTPNGPWVNPCPCSLEAHEACMLRWVAETESSSSTRSKGLRCPACRAQIRVDEPYDALVAFHNTIHRAYSRASPIILVTLLSSGTLVGSAWYGWNAVSVFAGPRAAYRWLGISSLREMRRQGPLWHALVSSVYRLTELAMVGPAMVLLWVLPSLGYSFIPTSLLYASSLLARDQLPTWPPSPQWAIAIMPHVHFAYRFVYSELIGPFEKRLNRALRGRPPTDEPPPEGAPAQGGAAQPEQAEEDLGNPGTWTLVIALARAAYTLFNEEERPEGNGDAAPAGVEVEVRIGAGDQVEADEMELAANREDLVEAIQDEFQVVQQEQEAAEQQHQRQEGPAPQPAPAAAAPARQNRRNRRRNRAPDAEAAPIDEPRQTLMGYITTSVTTSLLLPGISFAIGEVIRRVAPVSWTRRPSYRKPPTGLLQERWGRSLAGACLFFVLRDAFALAYKYRKVKAKQGRRVRNVAKGNQETESTAPAM